MKEQAATSPLSPQQRRISSDFLRKGSIVGDSYVENILPNLGLESPPAGTVLNLGVGSQQTFENFVASQFPETRLISLDYMLKNPLFAEEVREFAEPGNETPLVAALAQELPFADSSFDSVISHASLPVYLGAEFLPDSESHLRAFYSEVLRVLKPGGEARFAPLMIPDTCTALKILSELGLEPKDANFEFFTPNQRKGEKWCRLIVTKPLPKRRSLI